MALTHPDPTEQRAATATDRLGDLGALFGGALPQDAAVTERWSSRTAELVRIQGSGDGPWSDVVVKVPDVGRRFDAPGLDAQSHWLAKVLADAGCEDWEISVSLDFDERIPAICFPYIAGTDLTVAFHEIDVATRDDLLHRCGQLLGLLHMAGRQDEILGVDDRAKAVDEATKVSRRIGVSYRRLLRGKRRPFVVWSVDDFGPVNVRVGADGLLHLLDPPAAPIARIVEADLGRFILGCWQQLVVNARRPSREVLGSIEHFMAGYCETGPVPREHLNQELIDRRVAYQFLQKVVARLRRRHFRDAWRMFVPLVRWRFSRSAPPAAPTPST